MLKITDLNKLKFTSVKQCDCIIHFRYDGEDYTLVKKLDSDGNVTKKFALYKGRCKGKLELIGEAEGDTNYLIEYLYFRVNLKTIDKENFVRILQCYGLVDYEANRYKLTKSELAIFHRVIRNEDFYKSMRNYGMFRYIPSDMSIEKCLADCEVIKDPDRVGTRAIYMWFRNKLIEKSKNRKKEIKMNNNTKTNWVFNSQEDNNDAKLYSNIEAQVLANIASEIYEEIKDLTENAESVSIKVGNNKPVSFSIDELAEKTSRKS